MKLRGVGVLLAEPLVQFIVLGLLLYIALGIFAPERLVMQDSSVIVVDDEHLKTYLQFQRKSFAAESAQQLLGAMSGEQKQQLIEDYVRDEALFREALALGLNENDEIIRRRLIQKMEYLAQGFYNQIPQLSEQQLIDYFTDNEQHYQLPASITFTHVFLKVNARNRSKETQTTLSAANKLRTTLNNKSVLFSQAGQYGDRFLYNLNYVDRDSDTIASHFGSTFQQSLFALDSSKAWQGPIQSDYGVHLVLISNKTARRLPMLSEVAAAVLADARREQQSELKNKAIAEIINQYRISSPSKPH